MPTRHTTRLALLVFSLALPSCGGQGGGASAVPLIDGCFEWDEREYFPGLCLPGPDEVRVAVDLSGDCWLVSQPTCVPFGWALAEDRPDSACNSIPNGGYCEEE
jgi:hypothetical protein